MFLLVATRQAWPAQQIDLVGETLTLLNSFAFAASGQNPRRFADITGLSLTPGEIRILEFLNGRAPTQVSLVAEGLGLRLSGVSRSTRDMENRGYLERTRDVVDSRRSLLSISGSMQQAMDQWLTTWISQYLRPVYSWTADDISRLRTWFKVVHECLDAWSPGWPASGAAVRWLDVSADDADIPDHVKMLGEAAITLFSWGGEARWFDALLAETNVSFGQQLYFTLHIIARHGPVPVTVVAERTGVDHTQASKRVKRLVELRLVERGVDSFDRRSTLLRCTRRGREIEGTVVDEQYRAVTASIHKAATDAELETWEVLLARYIDGLSRDQLTGTSRSVGARPSYERR